MNRLCVIFLVVSLSLSAELFGAQNGPGPSGSGISGNQNTPAKGESGGAVPTNNPSQANTAVGNRNTAPNGNSVTVNQQGAAQPPKSPGGQRSQSNGVQPSGNAGTGAGNLQNGIPNNTNQQSPTLIPPGAQGYQTQSNVQFYYPNQQAATQLNNGQGQINGTTVSSGQQGLVDPQGRVQGYVPIPGGVVPNPGSLMNNAANGINQVPAQSQNGVNTQLLNNGLYLPNQQPISPAINGQTMMNGNIYSINQQGVAQVQQNQAGSPGTTFPNSTTLNGNAATNNVMATSQVQNNLQVPANPQARTYVRIYVPNEQPTMQVINTQALPNGNSGGAVQQGVDPQGRLPGLIPVPGGVTPNAGSLMNNSSNGTNQVVNQGQIGVQGNNTLPANPQMQTNGQFSVSNQQLVPQAINGQGSLNPTALPQQSTSPQPGAQGLLPSPSGAVPSPNSLMNNSTLGINSTVNQTQAVPPLNTQVQGNGTYYYPNQLVSSPTINGQASLNANMNGFAPQGTSYYQASAPYREFPGRVSIPTEPTTGAINLHPWFMQTAIRQQLNLAPEQANLLNQQYAQLYANYNASAGQLKNLAVVSDGSAVTSNHNANQFYANLDAAMRNLLTENQRIRFNQLAFQYRGYQAFQDPQISERLLLSDAQKRQLGEYEQVYNDQLKYAYLIRSVDPNVLPDRLNSLRREMNARISGMLSESQLRLWNELIGDPYFFPIQE
ncbi:MAG: hypothetical protein QM703_13670 [Gemmatales bacterium]